MNHLALTQIDLIMFYHFCDIVKIEFKTKDSEFVDSKHYKRLIENAMNCLKSSVSTKKNNLYQNCCKLKNRIKRVYKFG